MNRHAGSTRPPGAHRYVTRVYYEDTDVSGVVYHATYLRMAERARTEALRDLGVPHAEMASQYGRFFVVRRAKLDYAAPARLDEELVVITEPISFGSATVELRQSFFRGAVAPDDKQADEATAGGAQEGDLSNRPLVVAEIALVCVGRSDRDAAAFVPARIPDRWRAALVSLAAERDEGS